MGAQLKIISWNINGLKRATSDDDFHYFIKNTDADFYCFQETRSDDKIEIKPDFLYYCNSGNQKGYSGVAIATKEKPLKVIKSLGDVNLDDEGRFIALEYDSYFIVNIYAPSSVKKGLERYFYRQQFDEAILGMLRDLNQIKPIIVCGDFNVAHEYIDINAKAIKNIENPPGFLDEERDRFAQILGAGFIDTFRFAYPEERIYTWHCVLKGGEKQVDFGSRLDYILVSSDYEKSITDAWIEEDSYGSDHCPIMATVTQTIRPKPKSLADDYTEEELGQMWRDFDFINAEYELKEFQKKVTYAAYSGNEERILIAQQRITSSRNAKALAVRHVAKRTNVAGVDGEIWRTDADKMRAVLTLTNVGYRAKPAKQICITEKFTGRERRLGIHTCYDKAMHVLYAYALDPVSEAKAAHKSFGFRKGRCANDAHAYLMRYLKFTNAPEWVLVGDIKSYYPSISHRWIKSMIPMDKTVLTEFLGAGHIFNGEFFPSPEQGISLGTSLSPILANMTLDTMNNFLCKKLDQHPEVTGKYNLGNMIRFADDFIVLFHSKRDAEIAKDILSEFLELRGLIFNEDKTKIVHIEEGFDFLARHYSKIPTGGVRATPSQRAVAKFEWRLKETILGHKGSQKALIDSLNQKLQGWAHYHRITDARVAFRRIDAVVQALLIQASCAKHPTLTQQQVLNKYWFFNKRGRRVYALPSKKECQVIEIKDIVYHFHHHVDIMANPYLHHHYFSDREEDRAIQNVTGEYKSIWHRQQGLCYYCGKPMLPDQERYLIQFSDIPNGKSIRNLAYIHAVCDGSELVHVQTEKDLTALTDFDVMYMLKTLKALRSRKIRRTMTAAELLSNYFLHQKSPTVTLEFWQIESIMENKLNELALAIEDYWFDEESEESICYAWTTQGYTVQSVSLENKKVVFKYSGATKSQLIIPEIFLSTKIPDNAKYELESFFKYIKGKYGL